MPFNFHPDHCRFLAIGAMIALKNKKIIIAGGTGFIGQEMIRYFGKDNNIVVLTRQSANTENNRHHYSILVKEDLQNLRYVKWNGQSTGDWASELEGADLLINLAGKTVNCRYTEKNKKPRSDTNFTSFTELFPKPLFFM